MRALLRKATDRLMWLICALVSAIAVLPLLLVLYYVARKGLPALNATFFTHMPVPVGETDGGMKHSIVGTLVVLGLILWAVERERRTRALRDRFGPEYEHAVHEKGDRSDLRN